VIECLTSFIGGHIIYFDKSRTSNVAISIPYSNYSSILTRFRDVASYWREKNREHKLQCRNARRRKLTSYGFHVFHVHVQQIIGFEQFNILQPDWFRSNGQLDHNLKQQHIVTNRSVSSGKFTYVSDESIPDK